MEGRRTRGPIGRALLAGDRPPGKSRATEPELLRPIAGDGQRRVAPAQCVTHGIGRGVAEDGEDKGLGIPEGVAVVAGARQPLRRDRPALPPRGCLEDAEERVAHRELPFGIAVDLHVGAVPEVVEVGALLSQQAIPTGVRGARQGADGLGADRVQAASGRPAVREELGDRKALARLEVHRQGEARYVIERFGGRGQIRRCVDHVVHRRGHDRPLPRVAWLSIARSPGRSPAGRRAARVAQQRLADRRSRVRRLVGHEL